MGDFTLLLPTYNRPQQLAALLGYLEAERADCHVLVLDSSRPEIAAFNRERTARSTLDAEYAEFPTETRPFDKFHRGVDMVTTPFCGLCADDDLIVVDGVRRCVEALQGNPKAAVAQGYSFSFSYEPDDGVALQNILYFTSTISDPTPLSRLAKLFRQYQAATYGVYRSSVLRQIYSIVQPVGDVLATELLGNALAAVEGHMIRLPCFSHGRSVGASESYEHWHPLEWFAKDPQGLFAAYQTYRDVLTEAVMLRPDNGHSSNDVRHILDLIHLVYFVQHAPKAAVEFITEQAIAGAPLSSYWQRPEIQLPLYQAAGFEIPRTGLIKNLYRRLQFLRAAWDAGRGARRRHRRNYHRHPNFSAPSHAELPQPAEIKGLLDSLGNYQFPSPPPALRRQVSVAVLLCNYNDSQYLPDSLSAICGQTRPPDEFIIVDDGSTDNSIDIIEDFARRYRFIRVLKNERNCGQLYSIERALAQARSDFIVWAAADDRLLPNFLERNVECLAQNPNAQMTLSRLATFRDGSDEINSYTEISHGPAFDLGTSARFWSPEELRERLRKKYLWLSGNTAVVRRSCLIQAGGFDKDLRWHADYFTFWVVALRNGVFTIPETLATIRQRPHTYSSTGMSSRSDQIATLGSLADKLITQGWRDIGLAAFFCPSLLSPFGLLMLEVLLLKPRRWPFAASYGRLIGAEYLSNKLKRIKEIAKLG